MSASNRPSDSGWMHLREEQFVPTRFQDADGGDNIFSEFLFTEDCLDDKSAYMRGSGDQINDEDKENLKKTTDVEAEEQ